LLRGVSRQPQQTQAGNQDREHSQRSENFSTFLISHVL